MPPQPTFRFAPSPNGFLHLGHAYSALFTWRAAAVLGGQALLRIEDIDTARCRPEYEAAIYEDLAWLGLDWPRPVMRQSERFAAHSEAIAGLKAMDLLYPCACSRSEIATHATLADPDGGPVYPGTCRELSPEAAAALVASGVPVQWRLRMDAAEAWIGDTLVMRECPADDLDVHFREERQRTVEPGLWGDVVLVRKDTPTSYHLGVVVDDAAQGVTHVTRGMDLSAQTDIHVLLQALLGLPTPAYAHHGLLMDSAENKLSKSAGSAALRDLRAAGWTGEDVRRRLGFEG